MRLDWHNSCGDLIYELLALQTMGLLYVQPVATVCVEEGPNSNDGRSYLDLDPTAITAGFNEGS